MSASLEARDKEFYLKGEKIRILSGAVHYFRIVPDYWLDRLQKLKFCGLNCVETYVPWNLHEEIKGEFKFEGILDLRSFIKMAHSLGLYVILRPGPYICSEWEFGGLPSWLLSDANMKVRSSYEPYLQAVEEYFNKLLPLVTDLQHSRGGPIICLQLENEYGAYAADLNYMNFLRQNMLKNGIVEMLFTSDGGPGLQGEKLNDAPMSVELLIDHSFHIQNPHHSNKRLTVIIKYAVLMTLNFQLKEYGYLMHEYVRNVKQPNKPLFVMEFWSGWFDHWGEKHQILPNESSIVFIYYQFY
ncbi:hypothetical protein HELRODRAFT_195009 [Helobdella robusta]|uniref:Glycoside hydrolase 35 catalytic domain-containing protein n=1 Tax=Helobdella robusta TaxID=6412 RepID=T1FWN3_HELRO|nr:hypothetical protein HELRODRAFT_195009 [Helobdella robusta]ESO09774.1 hypothetical protein HELRODRAFT_195009 [Helobdella robusta]